MVHVSYGAIPPFFMSAFHIQTFSAPHPRRRWEAAFSLPLQEGRILECGANPGQEGNTPREAFSAQKINKSPGGRNLDRLGENPSSKEISPSKSSFCSEEYALIRRKTPWPSVSFLSFEIGASQNEWSEIQFRGGNYFAAAIALEILQE
jgi:hypothetical protein